MDALGKFVDALIEVAPGWSLPLLLSIGVGAFIVWQALRFQQKKVDEADEESPAKIVWRDRFAEWDEMRSRIEQAERRVAESEAQSMAANMAVVNLKSYVLTGYTHQLNLLATIEREHDHINGDELVPLREQIGQSIASLTAMQVGEQAK